MFVGSLRRLFVAGVGRVARGLAGRDGAPTVLGRGRRWLRGRAGLGDPRDAPDTSDEESTQTPDEHQLTWTERVKAVFAGPVNITEVRIIRYAAE